MLSITHSRSLPKLMSIESVISSKLLILILCHLLLLLPSIFPSIGVFSSESVLIGLTSLQSRGLARIFSNTIVQKHQFAGAQPSLWSNSHLYMTTGKTITLTRQTFVGKVKSLLFNMLSRLVIGFLPRSKCLLISWLQSPSAVILEPPKIKSVTVFIVSTSICHGVMGLDAMILVF